MKNIYVLTIEEKSCDYLVNTLQENIGDFANVFALNRKQSTRELEQSTLIITAGKKSHEKARTLFSSNQIIMARRNLDFTKLGKIRSLPKGETVLVINYSQPPTIETIHSLKKLGLNHLSYVPYWKDSQINAENFDTALSPGMIDLCPENVNRKIDIGMRNICLSTYIQILLHLEMDLDYINIFTQNYMNSQIEAYKYLNNELERLRASKNNMQSIFNNLDDGLVFIDKDYNISYLNSASENIIGIDKTELLGEYAEKLYRYLPELSNFMMPDSINNNKIFNIKGKTYMGSCISLAEESQGGIILTFRDVSKGIPRESSKKHFIVEKGFTANYFFKDIIGEADSMKALIERARLISRTDSTVLLMGESGTGKELFAHAIHNGSLRRNAPFIAVNFAALPENLVESELFGYEDGSFTGAKKGGRAGLFEQAHGGTIFLDEIGDASLHTQKRLLRVLQDREIMRIGATKKTQLDVRIIAATNRDLLNLIEKELFREDLYYRLRVCALTIPPLRERKSDIPKFIEAFMDKYKIRKFFSDEVKEVFVNYPWPGNVRELENTIEYIANISRNALVELQDLLEEIRRNSNPSKEIDNLKETTEELKCLFHQRDIFFLLRTLLQHKAKGTSIGRKRLASLAKEQGIPLTENKIRTRLEHLANHGLVVMGKTKQGTLITEKGESALLEFRI